MPPPTQTPLPSSKGVGVGGGKANCLKGGENVNVAQEKVILDVVSERSEDSHFCYSEVLLKNLFHMKFISLITNLL